MNNPNPFCIRYEPETIKGKKPKQKNINRNFLPSISELTKARIVTYDKNRINAEPKKSPKLWKISKKKL